MRVLLLALVALLAVPGPSMAAGNVVLLGAGTGTHQSLEGTTTCAEAPFTVAVAYNPDGTASLASAFYGCANVGLTVLGPRIAFSSAQNPPLTITFHCRGSEASGLDCASSDPLDLTATVGPSAGPGSAVAFATTGTFRFAGTFTAL